MSLIDTIRQLTQANQGGGAPGVNPGLLQKTSQPSAQPAPYQPHTLEDAMDWTNSGGDAWNAIGREGVLGYMRNDLRNKYGTDDLSKFRYIEDASVPGGYRLDWQGRQENVSGFKDALRRASLQTGIINGAPAGASSDGSPFSMGNPSENLNVGATWEGKGGTGYGFYRDPNKPNGVGFRSGSQSSNDTADVLMAAATVGGGMLGGQFLGGMTGGAGAAGGAASGAGGSLYGLGGTGTGFGGASSGLGLSGSSLGLGGAPTGLGLSAGSAGATGFGAGIGTSGLAAGTGSLLPAGFGGSGAAPAFTGQGLSLGGGTQGLTAGSQGLGMTPASPGASTIGAGIGTSPMASGTGSLLASSMTTAAEPSLLQTMTSALTDPVNVTKTLAPNLLQSILSNKGAQDMAGIVAGLTDAQRQGNASDEMRRWLEENRMKMESLYNPNSPEYSQLWEQMSRKDAAAGRNSQYGPRSAQFAAEVARNRADNIRNFTTGTSRAYADALNQDAGKYAGLSSALQRAFADGRSLDLNRIIKLVESGGASPTGMTSDAFWGLVGEEGAPIDYGAGMPDPTEDDIWNWINGGDLGQFF